MLLYAVFAAGIQGQECARNADTLDCSNLNLTAVPTAQQYGDIFPVVLSLFVTNQAIAEIPDNGFNVCPHTSARTLSVHTNQITTVGAHAFSTLTRLELLYLQNNQITWMAQTSLAGLAQLEQLYLHNNVIEHFDYGALLFMTALKTLYLYAQAIPDPCDVSCNGVCPALWNNNQSAINAAVTTCGAAESLCVDGAVACSIVEITNCPLNVEPTPAETTHTLQSMFGYYPVKYGVADADAYAAGYTKVLIVHGHTLYMRDDPVNNVYGTDVLNCTDCTQGECAYARHVRVPGSHVSPNSFRECKYLETVSMEGNEICANSFVGNTRLRSVTSAQSPLLVENRPTVLSNCFGYGLEGNGSYFTANPIQCHPCAGKIELVIPETVTRINSGAFMGCKDTKHVTIASTVEHIADLAFQYTHALEEVNLLSSPTINPGAFPSCLGYGIEAAADSNTTITCVPCAGKSVVVPDTATRINTGFERCPMDQIDLPAGITVISEAFRDTNQLRSARLHAGATGSFNLTACDLEVESGPSVVCNCTVNETSCFDPTTAAPTIWSTRATTTHALPVAKLPTQQADTYGTSALTATLLAVVGCAVAVLALAWRRKAQKDSLYGSI